MLFAYITCSCKLPILTMLHLLNSHLHIYQYQNSSLTVFNLFIILFADDTRVRPLVMESTSDVVVLPLDAGQQYKLFTVATDYVGNQQQLSEAMNNVLTADNPVIIGVCRNDCSSSGNCTELNNCRCESGFYGIDCSQSKYSKIGDLHLP